MTICVGALKLVVNYWLLRINGSDIQWCFSVDCELLR